MVETKVVNIVASAGLGVSLDLNEISERFDEADYNKKNFPGLIWRMKKPKVALLLFTSGKLVCTGGKTIEQTKEAINIIRDHLKSLFTERHPDELKNLPENIDVNIQNMVATSDLNTVINLNKAAIYLSFEKVEYEPEQFPGLVYRLEEPRVVTLIFGSGKIVCTGAKNLKDIEKAMDIIIDDLKGIGML